MSSGIGCVVMSRLRVKSSSEGRGSRRSQPKSLMAALVLRWARARPAVGVAQPVRLFGGLLVSCEDDEVVEEEEGVVE